LDGKRQIKGIDFRMSALWEIKQGEMLLQYFLRPYFFCNYMNMLCLPRSENYTAFFFNLASPTSQRITLIYVIVKFWNNIGGNVVRENCV
jgi:hypothetical protein